MQLLKDIYNSAEDLRGRKLLTITAVLTLIFFGIGIFIGYLNNRLLNQNENNPAVTLPPPVVDTSTTFFGKISYVNPDYYPGEEISYVLTDASGKDIVLLKADDDKLSLAEGLTAKVKGKEMVSKAGTKYLMVKEVIINASN
ncbi:MAG: hypothetical protein KatS3mg101_0147 [Patescibacteria group bacterium]|nr:MAG: hypothetical protein KatS3mg101_0147 [Patescibacteria group bacterium]